MGARREPPIGVISCDAPNAFLLEKAKYTVFASSSARVRAASKALFSAVSRLADVAGAPWAL
jgi:hypothetical protein